MARLSGTNRDDVFNVNAMNLANLQVKGGRGFDTLRVTGSNSVNISSAITSQWRELEALNLTDFSGALSLAINANMLSTSATGSLAITTSQNSTLTLSATLFGVQLFGDGTVQLSNATNNVVQLASSEVDVIGGNLNDTISASSYGNVLDGGLGNDVLIAGTGADIVRHDATDANDTVKAFNVAYDKIDLSGHNTISYFELQQGFISTINGTMVVLPDGGSLLIEGIDATNLTREIFIQNGQPISEFSAIVKITAGTSAAAVNAIIAAVSDGTTIMFMDGQHNFSERIVVNRDNVTLVGQSPSGTQFIFDVASTGNLPFIAIGTGEKIYISVTTENANATATSLHLAQTTGLSVGDVIYIYQPNTADYLLANGWSNVSFAEAESRPFREFITTITAINGTEVILADALPFDFANAETRVFELNVVAGVHVRDLTVSSTLGEANAFDFSNTQPSLAGHSVIAANGTTGLHLSGLTLLNNPSTGISLSSSINAEFSNISVIGAHNKGGEGNGYGILLSESFNNNLTDLTLLDGRHSLVFSAWNSETSNAVEVTLTNRDINFHGGPDAGNSVHVVRSELSYDVNIDPSVWSIVSGGATNHAATDIWNQNSVSFEFAIGSSASDKIIGANVGSYLNGMGNNDTIIGGTGIDTIVGGLRRDTMSGGGGSDLFILQLGDDLDQITDFQFGSGGDVLVFTGNALVNNMQDLVFTQEGSNLRVRYGSNSTVILQNTQFAEVDPSNFVFDPTGVNYHDLWLGQIL